MNNRFSEITGGLLNRGRAVRFTVRGLSMRPALRDGDVLTVYPVKHESLRPGDIVLYMRDARPLIHRIVKIVRDRNGLRALIRGDFCFGPPEAVAAADIRGRVGARERNGRRTVFSGPRHRAAAVISLGAARLLNRAAPVVIRINSLFTGRKR